MNREIEIPLSKAKEMINEARQQERKRIIEVGKAMFKEPYYSCPRPTCKENPDICRHVGEWIGYNKAITELLEDIKGKLK